jgi:hypothetical protein
VIVVFTFYYRHAGAATGITKRAASHMKMSEANVVVEGYRPLVSQPIKVL